jgi:hypothetical protein
MCQCHDVYRDEPVTVDHDPAKNSVIGDQCHDEYETIPPTESVDNDETDLLVPRRR